MFITLPTDNTPESYDKVLNQKRIISKETFNEIKSSGGSLTDKVLVEKQEEIEKLTREKEGKLLYYGFHLLVGI